MLLVQSVDVSYTGKKSGEVNSIAQKLCINPWAQKKTRSCMKTPHSGY